MDDILIRNAYYTQQSTYLQQQSYLQQHYHQQQFMHHDQYIAAATAAYNQQFLSNSSSLIQTNNNECDEDLPTIKRRKLEQQQQINTSPGN